MVEFTLRIPSKVLKWKCPKKMLGDELKITRDYVELTDGFSLVRFEIENTFPEELEVDYMLLDLSFITKLKRYSTKLPNILDFRITYTENTEDNRLVEFEDVVINYARMKIVNAKKKAIYPDTDMFMKDYKDLNVLKNTKKFNKDILARIQDNKITFKDNDEIILQENLNFKINDVNVSFYKDKKSNALVFLDKKKEALYCFDKPFENKDWVIMYIKQENIIFVELLR